MFSSLLFLKEDKAIVLEETFLEKKEAETLFEGVITQATEIRQKYTLISSNTRELDRVPSTS